MFTEINKEHVNNITEVFVVIMVTEILNKKGHFFCVGFVAVYLNSLYLLTPWCRVLLEKLTGLQLLKTFPAFHGTRSFITALTSVRHPSLSSASPFQSIYPHPISWRCILILSTHLRLGLPSGLLPSGFLSKNLHPPSPHPYAPHAQSISFFSILSPAQYWVSSTNHMAPRYAVSSHISTINTQLCQTSTYTAL